MSAESRRRAYLEALDIDVYTLRGSETAAVESDPGIVDDTQAKRAGNGEPATMDAGWDGLRSIVSGCKLCGLHETRTQTVFGVGNPEADWMIVGEAPGQEEDRRGEPFVGRAGKLLDEMLYALGLDRQSVFIANILKCRPPGNRDPSPDESRTCRPYLDRQIELVSPRLILAVGRVAAQQLLHTDAPVGRLRGAKHELGDRQLPVVVTYHPAYLLRSPTQKRKAWADLVLARQIFESAS